MSRNTSGNWSSWEKDIIKRRETLSDGSTWPMNEWDYTEWEEFLQEIEQKSVNYEEYGDDLLPNKHQRWPY